MKLEPADAELADEAARLAGTRLALRRVDAGERVSTSLLAAAFSATSSLA
jgi:hypothetical protein